MPTAKAETAAKGASCTEPKATAAGLPAKSSETGFTAEIAVRAT